MPGLTWGRSRARPTSDGRSKVTVIPNRVVIVQGGGSDVTGTAALTGTGDLAAIGHVQGVEFGSAALTGAGTLAALGTAAPAPAAVGSAALTGLGTLAATGSATNLPDLVVQTPDWTT